MSEVIDYAFEIVDELFKEKKWAECEALLKEILKVEENPQVYHFLGMIAFQNVKMKKDL